MKPAPEQPVEIGAPIQPPAPAEGTLVELRENPAGAAGSTTLSEAILPSESAPAITQEPAPTPQETPAVTGTPQISEPAPPKAREGELVDLGKVNAAPILIRGWSPSIRRSP